MVSARGAARSRNTRAPMPHPTWFVVAALAADESTRYGCPWPQRSRPLQSLNRVVWMFWDKGENSSMTQLSGTSAYGSSPSQDAGLRKMALHVWRAMNPTWEVRVLNTATASKLAPRFAAATRKVGPGRVCIQLQADLLRAELLSLYGGVWADTTTVPVHPLDSWIEDLLAPGGFWAFVDEIGGQPLSKKIPGGDCFKVRFGHQQRSKCMPTWVYKNYHAVQGVLNWFLAVDRPHHPLMDAWLDEYARNLERVAKESTKKRLVAKGVSGVAEGPPYFLQACSLTAISDKPSVRRALEAMAPPCGATSTASLVSGRAHKRIDPSMLLYKRTAVPQKAFAHWLANASARPEWRRVQAVQSAVLRRVPSIRRVEAAQRKPWTLPFGWGGPLVKP